MKFIYACAAFVAIAAVLYGFGAFVAAELNPIRWPSEGRFMIGFFSLVLGGMASVYISCEYKAKP